MNCQNNCKRTFYLSIYCKLKKFVEKSRHQFNLMQLTCCFNLQPRNFVAWQCLRWEVIRATMLFNLERNNWNATMLRASWRKMLPVLPGLLGWFPRRKTFLRTGTDRKVSFVFEPVVPTESSQHKGNFPVRSRPEENYPEWKPAFSKNAFLSHMKLNRRFFVLPPL